MGYTGTRLVLVYRSSTGLQGTGLVHGVHELYKCRNGGQVSYSGTGVVQE
jgi:hypothetical protein